MPPKNNPKNTCTIYRQKKRHSRPGERDSIHPNLKTLQLQKRAASKGMRLAHWQWGCEE
jgi:hypothetical protein